MITLDKPIQTNQTQTTMEYKKDLLAIPRRSKSAIVIGVLLSIFTFFWIISRLKNNQVVTPMDWLSTVLLGLNGLVYILGGLGFSFMRFFGESFIDIDSDRMKFKLGIFEKQSKIEWQDITAIDYKPNAFMISQGDNKTQVIKISNLDYSSISEIKAVISKIAADKQVNYSIA